MSENSNSIQITEIINLLQTMYFFQLHQTGYIHCNKHLHMAQIKQTRVP